MMIMVMRRTKPNQPKTRLDEAIGGEHRFLAGHSSPGQTRTNGVTTLGKSPFLMGKSPFLMGKSPFSMGKSTINGPCSNHNPRISQKKTGQEKVLDHSKVGPPSYKLVYKPQ